MTLENRRAELFWNLRERLERGELALPDDDELVGDLAGIRYFFAQDGKIQLESKEEVRKRLGRSPDRADAVALAAPTDRATQALAEWNADLHVVDDFLIPRDWNYLGGLSFGYLDEGGIFVVLAVGPDGDTVCVDELPLYRVTPYECGWLIGQMCGLYPERLVIASGEEIWAKSGIGAPTIAEEIQIGIFAVYGDDRDRSPVVVNTTGGPGSAGARLALLHRYLSWKAGPGGDVPYISRPLLRVLRKCTRTAQALPSLALDPADRERVLENPVYDAVTAALMSRPQVPERPPEPEKLDHNRHPRFDWEGRRLRRWEKALQAKPDYRGGWRVPRRSELVPLEEDDFYY